MRVAAAADTQTPEKVKVCAEANCAHAGVPQPWSAFNAKVKWPDGTTRQPHAYCKDCQREYCRDWHERKRRNDAEWSRQRQRAQQEADRRDPERYALSLARRRDWARKRYDYRTEKPRGRQRGPDVVPTLDTAPFVTWLRTLGANAEQIGLATNINPAYVRRMLKGEYAAVELDTVDRAVLHADVVVDGLPVTLDSLYPLEDAA